MLGGPAVLLADIFILAVKIAVALLQITFRFMCPSPPKSLQGEVILVTGAGHGLGHHLALQLASLGAIVVGWDVDADKIKTTVKEIALQGKKAFGYVCDVSDRTAVMKTAGAVKRDVGSVTMAVNNAAILQYGSVLNQSPEEVRRHFDVNVLAHFWVLQAVLPGMVAQRRGHVVTLCSMSGLCGSPDMAAYSSSKFALRGLMEALREEIRLDPRGLDIHCTCVYPFFIDTGMAKNPHFRFPCMFAPMPPDEAAREIIAAVRSNCSELSLPRSLLWADRINRLLPKAVVNHGMDFLRGDGVRQCYLQLSEADTQQNDQM